MLRSHDLGRGTCRGSACCGGQIQLPLSTRLDKIKNFHMPNTIATENSGIHGRWGWGNSGPSAGCKVRFPLYGPDWTKSRTEADSRLTPSLGMGTVYVSVASSPTTSMPSTKLRMSAFRSGIVPSFRNSRKSATYSRISSVVGSSTLRPSSWVSA